MTAFNVAKKILQAKAVGGLDQLPVAGQPLEHQFTRVLCQEATGTDVAPAFKKIVLDLIETILVAMAVHKTLQVYCIDCGGEVSLSQGKRMGAFP